MTDEFKGKLKSNVYELFEFLEKNLHAELDWGDTSVYTGVAGYIYLYIHLDEVFDDSQIFKVGNWLLIDLLV